MKTFVAIIVVILFRTVSLFSEGVLTLEKSVEIALENNIRLDAGRERIYQSEYTRMDARTLFLPKLSTGFNYSLLDSASMMSDRNIYQLNFTISQPLMAGGRLTYLYRQAQKGEKISGYEYNSIEQDIAYEVTRGYFAILRAGRLIENANAMKKMAEEHLKVTEAFFVEGMVTRLDVIKTEVFLSSVEQNILQAENGLKIAEANFNFILNRPLESDVNVEDILERENEKHPLIYWTGLALTRHPELKKASAGLDISAISVEVEKSRYYPQANIFYNYGFDRGSPGALDGWERSWTIGLGVELDIWNWGQTGYKVQRAEHQKRQLQEEIKLLRSMIELEVKNAYLNIGTAEKEIAAAKKAIEQAAEGLRVAEILYREDMAVTADVLDAQTELTIARNNYQQALFAYHIAHAGLLRSAGIMPVE